MAEDVSRSQFVKKGLYTRQGNAQICVTEKSLCCHVEAGLEGKR